MVRGKKKPRPPLWGWANYLLEVRVESGGDRIRTGVQTSSSKAFYMFILVLLVGSEQEPDKPIHFVAAIILRKYRSSPTRRDLLSATCFVFESAAGRGNRSTGPAALMTT